MIENIHMQVRRNFSRFVNVYTFIYIYIYIYIFYIYIYIYIYFKYIYSREIYKLQL